MPHKLDEIRERLQIMKEAERDGISYESVKWYAHLCPVEDISHLLSKVEELERELDRYRSAYFAEEHWRKDETRHKENLEAENERLRSKLEQRENELTEVMRGPGY